MEILQTVCLIVAMLSGISLGIFTCVAYGARSDKTFWGGSSILNGWWLITPHGKSGIGAEHKNLVFWARLSLISCLGFGYAAYLLGN